MSTSVMVKVSLTKHNLLYAAFIGISRRVKGIGKPGRYGVNNQDVGWNIDCDSCCAEAAVAKHFNLWWDGALGNFTAADVGSKIQVRSTRWKSGKLILHKDDSDDHLFILVLTHEEPVMILAGWIYGKDGKKEKWWDVDGKNFPAYFIKQSDLNDMNDFPGWIFSKEMSERGNNDDFRLAL